MTTVKDTTTGKELTAANGSVAASYCSYMNSLAGFKRYIVIG